MSEYQMQDGDITIFKNKDKKEPKHPDYRGKMMVNGEIKDVALWVKESKKTGEKFFAGKHTEQYKKEPSETNQQQKQQQTESKPIDDGLPF